MDLQTRLKSNQSYKITVENVNTLRKFFLNSVEGRIEKGCYELSKNFPIKEYDYTENIKNEYRFDIYITTGGVAGSYTLSDLWNYLKTNSDTIGISLELINISEVQENEKPDLDTWLQDLIDGLPEGVKGSYKEIKTFLIILIILYLINIVNDFIN